MIVADDGNNKCLKTPGFPQSPGSTQRLPQFSLHLRVNIGWRETGDSAAAR